MNKVIFQLSLFLIQMIDKYKKITIYILLFIPLVFGLFFIDSYILPNKTITDEIISYSEIYQTNSSNRFNKSKVLVGYVFYTKKGKNFSMQETYITESKVTLKESYIFKNITEVTSKVNDYTHKLMSGLSGATLYFSVGLIISVIVSLLYLYFDKKLTENGFQNIILFNGFLIICILYILVLHN
ncbi:hypothetical protein ACSVH5_12960 [Flavobacterium sp. RSSA_27]|uniref:hypothetical protein n=1 Tax=Flavobacterium sp. RSSA_27 TaxID=3447667 RepID=UPI003F389FCB